MKITNDQLKQLKEVAAMLPKSFYDGKRYHYEKAHDLRLNEIKNNALSIGAAPPSPTIIKEINPELYKSDTMYPINHLRRLKKAFKKDPVNGIKKYCEWVLSNHDKMFNSNALRFSMVRINEILKQKIKPIF